MDPQVYEDMSSVEGEHWWFVARRKYLARIIEKFVCQQDRKELELCEIGSGTGGNLPLLSQYGRVTAVEMDDVARQIIVDKQLPKVDSIKGGYLPDNIELEQQFDALFLLDVVEHVEDDLGAVAATRPMLNDQGVLVTTVPAYAWLWSKHDVANHHHRRYTLNKYRELMTNAGFDVTYASYFNTILFPLAALARLSESLLASKDSSEIDTGLQIPHPSLNAVFNGLFSLESAWAGKLRVPFGLSIVVVAKKTA